ncbi:MAG TPA: HU family DNA-binding protein, partial [Mesotoga sp.]|nr:HU family DNA-binding protein [Mesotoga sp.]
VERKPRKGVNPRTKKAIKIPGAKVPKFRAGKELKEKVQ